MKLNISRFRVSKSSSQSKSNTLPIRLANMASVRLKSLKPIFWEVHISRLGQKLCGDDYYTIGGELFNNHRNAI